MQLSMLPAALLALVPVVSAGYGGSSSGGSGSVSGSPQAQNDVTIINVGKNGQTMEPDDVVVPRGGVIEFHFFTGAHSVAQSAFDSPCTPLNATAGNGTEGFFSGPQQVSSGEGANVFRVVSTGSPMWYYCATQRHCQNGMVGVINKPANNAARTITTYKAGAARAASNVSPSAVRGGELAQANSPTGGTPTGGTGNGGSNTGGSGTGTGTGTGSSPTTSRPGNAGVGSFSGLSLPFLGLAAAAAIGLSL